MKFSNIDKIFFPEDTFKICGQKDWLFVFTYRIYLRIID